jgi:hypothetical protein
MKAWFVRAKDEVGAEIVFAETRGKAKAEALCTDCCSEARFVDIEVRREPIADKYYKEGKWHLDWDNPQDRLALVKDCGFACDPDYFDVEECERHCSAKEYCYMYRDYRESEGSE